MTAKVDVHGYGSSFTVWVVWLVGVDRSGAVSPEEVSESCVVGDCGLSSVRSVDLIDLRSEASDVGTDAGALIFDYPESAVVMGWWVWSYSKSDIGSGRVGRLFDSREGPANWVRVS